MSQLMELPDPVYSALEKAAEAQGTTPIGWIASQLAKNGVPGTAQTPGQTLADRFAGRVGHIRSGGQESLSEKCGEKFADHLEAKKRAGHL